MGEIRTLCDLFFSTMENHKRPDLLMRKRKGLWEVLSSEEVGRAVEETSCGLMALGVKPGDKVLLISEDRPKWLVADYAILTAGAVTVPVIASTRASAGGVPTGSSHRVPDRDQRPVRRAMRRRRTTVRRTAGAPRSAATRESARLDRPS